LYPSSSASPSCSTVGCATDYLACSASSSLLDIYRTRT
jgi:hypothetical protein